MRGWEKEKMENTSYLDFGFRPRPNWTRNWFDRLLVKINVTPFHVRKYIRDEMYVKGLLENIAKRCNNVGLCYSITVDWENEYISFWQLDKFTNKSLYQGISFKELLFNDFNPKKFVELMLHENSYLENTRSQLSS